ncbi:unnamed protein product [Phytophthora fragariaefolia]|uniref:Unnamed protein product n=1 Tax=Phytophthora fragariaefolia TaxID=1490495 RepID=A0A9W6XZ20_9STRA|nr:unnamed protein product [Phytophthora fragariaefolia]
MTANRDVDPVVFRLILDRVIKFASDMHPAWSVSERLTVFKSLASAKGEQLHRDFQSSETAMAAINHEWVQATFLLVLQSGTTLIVVPRGFMGCVSKAKCDALGSLEPGDLVLYRGDLPHAEASFEDDNMWIQGCINVNGIDHDERVVERVAWDFWRCKHCLMRCDIKRQLTNHFKSCDDNPEKAEIARRRNENNDKGDYCEACCNGPSVLHVSSDTLHT